MLINLKSKTHEILFFVLISILATVVESFTVSSGAWIYSHQHIINFPIWLPLYWGMGGIAIKNTHILVTKYFSK